MRRTRKRSLAASLATALAVSLALAAALAPAAFGKAEEIAYRCDLDICLADPDAFNSVVNLTDNGKKSLDEHPVWSPDGTRVAFVGTDPQNEANRTQNIYVMTPGKGEASNIATQLTFYLNAGDISELDWSPDGTRIAYRYALGGGSGVYAVAADGTTATPRTLAATGSHPSWSPDGTKVAYAATAQQIWTVNADGSGAAPLPGGEKGVEPAWSPDGSQIAFGRIAYQSVFVDLAIVGAGCGASPVTVPIPYPAEYTQWADASWSPAGDRLSYRSTFENGFGYERVVGRFGGASTPLPKVQGVNMGGGSAASWSPNGQRLAFDGFPEKSAGREIYIGNADGSGSVTTLSTGNSSYEPSWRPDPLVTPQVPVICPPPVPGVPPAGPGPAAGGLGGQRKPKLVWFTKKIPITANGPVHMMNVGCGAPDCGVNATGKTKAVQPRTAFRPATASKRPKRPKLITVGSGKLKLKEGQQKPLDLFLNKAGKKLLLAKGKLDIETTVTITSTGQAPVTSKKTIHVVLKQPKPKGKGKGKG